MADLCPQSLRGLPHNWTVESDDIPPRKTEPLLSTRSSRERKGEVRRRERQGAIPRITLPE